MRFQGDPKRIIGLGLAFQAIFVFVLFAWATPTHVHTYTETASQWKSYKDVAKWMSNHFSYDTARITEISYPSASPLSPRTPEETFELKSGICLDAAEFAEETLNRIEPLYEARKVYLDAQHGPDHWVCSFRMDGKLYIMDYGHPHREWVGVYGPYNSLDEYIKVYEMHILRRHKGHVFAIISID